MLSIPLYIFLFIYFFFLVIFVVFSIVNILHLTQTGSLTLASFFITFFTTASTILVLYATWWLLKDVDWQTQTTIWNSEWIQNLFSSGQFSAF